MHHKSFEKNCKRSRLKLQHQQLAESTTSLNIQMIFHQHGRKSSQISFFFTFNNFARESSREIDDFYELTPPPIYIDLFSSWNNLCTLGGKKNPAKGI